MRTILVLSSELAQVEQIEDFCRPLGYRVRSVSDRRIADEWCALKQFDVIIIDTAGFFSAGEDLKALSSFIERILMHAPLTGIAIIDGSNRLADDWSVSLLGARIFSGRSEREELYTFLSRVSLARREGFGQYDTVLLVDDLDSPREIIETYLITLGYQRVIGVASAPEALSKLRGEFSRIFCVLTDLKMPGMSGIALVQDIRADAALKLVPVVVFTAEPTADHLLNCVRAGATGFLAKPPRKEALKRELDKAKRIRLFRQSPVLFGPDDALRLEEALREITERRGGQR